MPESYHVISTQQASQEIGLVQQGLTHFTLPNGVELDVQTNSLELSLTDPTVGGLHFTLTDGFEYRSPINNKKYLISAREKTLIVELEK